MITENVDALLKDAGRYVEVKTELFRLKASDKAADTGSTIVATLVVGMVLLMALLLISAGLAFWVGKLLGEVFYGFFIVGGVYLLAAVILYAFKDSILRTPLYNSIINKLTR